MVTAEKIVTKRHRVTECRQIVTEVCVTETLVLEAFRYVKMILFSLNLTQRILPHHCAV